MSPLQALTGNPQTTMAETSAARFVAIGGSLRPNSLTYQALEVARREFEKLGIPLHILDLRQMKLPFVDGSESYADYPDVAVLRATMKRADGIILASPEYHGGKKARPAQRQRSRQETVKSPGAAPDPWESAPRSCCSATLLRLSSRPTPLSSTRAATSA